MLDSLAERATVVIQGGKSFCVLALSKTMGQEIGPGKESTQGMDAAAMTKVCVMMSLSITNLCHP